jgi:cell division protein FtsX
MFNLLAQSLHYGFYGLHGFLGIVLGLVLCLIIIWGLWAVFDILAAKFSSPETGWMFQIVKIILIVVTVIWFVNTIFGIF